MSKLRQLYKKQKEGLQKRHQESVNDKGSGMFTSYFSLAKAPEGVKIWKCAEGQHIIDIIPFIAGDQMPKVGASACKKGEFAWLIDVWVHRNIGVLDDTVICPARTNKDPCPICEHMRTERDKLTDEEYDNLKPKRRTLYLIWDHTTPTEEEKGVQVWDVAHFFMEDKIKPISERPRTGGTIQYFDPDEGKNVVFTRRGSTLTNTSYLGHRFEDRVEPIPDEILDQAFDLDRLLTYQSFDELKVAFLGGSSAEEHIVDGDDAKNTTKNAPFDTDQFETEEQPPQDADGTTEDVCPAGGSFGVDTDTLDDCETCPKWDDCSALALQEEEPSSTAKPKVAAKPAAVPATRAARRTTLR